MKSAIHQLVAGFTNGDAISNEAVVMRDLFRSWGYASDIYCETARILPSLRKQTKDISTCKSTVSRDDIVILHLSIGSAVNEVFPTLQCRKAILYHNVTPPHYYAFINKPVSWELEKGRIQARALAGVAELNMADSKFNADELVGMGYSRVETLPLIINIDSLEKECDAAILKRFNDGIVNVLFVGRCAPNKRIEDCLMAFHTFHRQVQPNSRFIHVGSSSGTERYAYLMKTRMKELGLDMNSVHFAGAVPQSQLNAFYRSAHIFLCMSEHEGFCIPILESMFFHVPVLAYAAGAVPETLAGSGILFREKDFPLIAETMGRVVNDAALRQAVVNRQDARISAYRARDPGNELRKLLAPLMQHA